jgi:hypothetical protein
VLGGLCMGSIGAQCCEVYLWNKIILCAVTITREKYEGGGYHKDNQRCQDIINSFLLSLYTDPLLLVKQETFSVIDKRKNETIIVTNITSCSEKIYQN